VTDRLLSLFPHFALVDWRTIPDILLLATILYVLYRTLRSMGTLKIVLGLALAGGVFVVASLLGLRGVEWLFSTFSHVALIGLIVLFQPEIRKVLERAAPLRWGHFERKLEQIPILVDEALFALAERRWGALVVFPGQDSVQAWASEGIMADATPSFPLLLSIFDPNSPGHDGAAIIDGGKVTRFAVRLPLSSTQGLSERLGTRHHAAMGLSESTDALVVAVSEERGVITVFRGGEHSVAARRGDVAARVREHWSDPASRGHMHRRPGRRWAVLGEVIVSLVVAAVFWSTVVPSRIETQEVQLTAPVEHAGLPSSLSLGAGRPLDARVRIEGPHSVIRSADLARVRVKVDVSQAVPGRQRIGLNESNVRLPRHLQLVAVEPDVLDLAFAAVETRSVPIRAQRVGSLPEGVTLASVRLNPSTAEVLVPSDLGGTGAITLMTAPIYLPAIREDTTIVAKMVAPAGVPPVDRRWPDVEVQIRVRTAGGQKTP
jgi:DNA integrity scanning protein DisA with diadenylate cyclase activity